MLRKRNFRCLLLCFLAAAGSTTCKAMSMKNQTHETKQAPLVRSDYSPGEVTRLCDEAIQITKKRLEEIVTLPESDRNPHNTLLEFEKVLADFSDSVSSLTFMGYVSTAPEISTEGSACEQKIGQFGVSVFTRKDLYDVLKSQDAQSQGMSTQEKRLLLETLKSFEENGLKLPEEKLSEVRTLKQKLALLESQFSTHLNQDNSVVEYTQSELDGVPKDYIASLKQSAGKYVVPTKEPDYLRIMQNATQGETRRKMLEAFENRAATENTRLLEEATALRKKIASLLGFKTWVDYRTQNRMAKNAETVIHFLKGLKNKLSARNKEDLAKLLKFKRELDPSASDIKAWDIGYLSYQLKKRDFNLSDEVVRPYFPAETVTRGLFEVYSTLFGVQFVEDKEAKVWAEGVKLYQIVEQKTKQLIGYFYADFIPRPGKYGHAAAFPLISGRMLNSGKYSLPVASIVANFTPPESGKPILLSHEEVRTLFHEFGHIMHQTLTRAPYASLSGSSVDQDFVEAPSQMLENWVFSEEILNLISGHYQNPSQKLPPEILQKLIEVRDFNQGYFYTRQLMFGLFDFTIHSSEVPSDISKFYRDLYRELFGIDAVSTSHFPATFGHLMGGYDAGYYGYLWSEVYAQDMFTVFEKQGLLSSQAGEQYRKVILESGKMQDASNLLQEFLGRQPNNEAFYKKLHITH